MANMSYCRWENTYKDLKDCLQSLTDGKESSSTEYRYYLRLVVLAEELVEDFNDLEEDEFVKGETNANLSK